MSFGLFLIQYPALGLRRLIIGEVPAPLFALRSQKMAGDLTGRVGVAGLFFLLLGSIYTLNNLDAYLLTASLGFLHPGGAGSFLLKLGELFSNF